MEPIDPEQKILSGFEKVWVGPPQDSDLAVDGAWAQFAQEPGNPPIYALLIQFHDDDLERIKNSGNCVYLFQITNSMVPFAFQHVDNLPHQPPTS
jgi:hypothetical protein